MGITYPYAQLTLVETPISFSGFARPNKGGSEMAQPGMLFLPERGVGMWNDYKADAAFKKRMVPELLSSYGSPEEMLSTDLIRAFDVLDRVPLFYKHDKIVVVFGDVPLFLVE